MITEPLVPLRLLDETVVTDGSNAYGEESIAQVKRKKKKKGGRMFHNMQLLKHKIGKWVVLI